MKFSEKKQAYNSLQGEQFLGSDTGLLQKLDPKSQALTLGILDKTRAQREILWHLLDFATIEEIKTNRASGSGSENHMEILTTLLSADVKENVEAILEIDEKMNSLIDIIGEDNLTQEQKETVAAKKGYLLQLLEKIEETEEAEFAARTKNLLLSTDIENAPQKDLAKLAKDLKLVTPDKKTETLRTLLQEYRLNLPKVGEATGEKNEGIPADPDKINELDSEKKNPETANPE